MFNVKLFHGFKSSAKWTPYTTLSENTVLVLWMLSQEKECEKSKGSNNLGYKISTSRDFKSAVITKIVIPPSLLSPKNIARGK